MIKQQNNCPSQTKEKEIMKNSYKRLGNYIREVNIRNTELTVTKLLGVSIQKVLIPSIANTVGTDMSTYKILKKGQFAYGPVTSRNGDKISIALLKDYEEAIVSQAYTCFEIINNEDLLPEYLMMWFQRPEFDRYARFKSHGSAREVFDWAEMCNIELPIPSIETQREVVAEYNALQKRIELNNRLIQKLEETAQAIYRQWFVDFEFPNEEGKPYKSSGGEMIESELGPIPKGWSIDGLNGILQFNNGKKKTSSKGIYPVYGGNGVIEYIDQYNASNTIVIGRVGAYCGSLFIEKKKCWISDNAISATPVNNNIAFCFYTLQRLNLNERSEGTSQPLITQALLNKIRTIIPVEQIINDFETIICTINKSLSDYSEQNNIINNIIVLLLSQMAK